MWISHRKEIRKLTFRALALRQSESRNCGLYVVYIQKYGATLLVGAWQREKQQNKLVEWKSFVDTGRIKSADLKTIFFSTVLYTWIKCHEIQTRMDDRAEARRLDIPLEEMRTRLLLDALQRCIGVITAAKAYEWFRFMQTYLPRCLNGEEIEG